MPVFQVFKCKKDSMLNNKKLCKFILKFGRFKLQYFTEEIII